jgi:CheY-like chemotaxis protein
MNVAAEPPVLRALVLDPDPAMSSLLGEWLEGAGYSVHEELPAGGCDLIVADVPRPRAGAPDTLKALARAHPGAPILALSSNFLAGAGAEIARGLGVSAVLPKPVSREALLRAVGRLVSRAA